MGTPLDACTAALADLQAIDEWLAGLLRESRRLRPALRRLAAGRGGWAEGLEHQDRLLARVEQDLRETREAAAGLARALALARRQAQCPRAGSP